METLRQVILECQLMACLPALALPRTEFTNEFYSRGRVVENEFSHSAKRDLASEGFVDGGRRPPTRFAISPI